jgi:hypothetical protein
MNSAAFWPQTLVDWAQVLSAIATTAAVMVSLYLARRRPLPELSGYAGVYLLVTPGTPGPWPEKVSITATNVGSVPALVTGVGWLVRTWPRPKWAAGVQDLSLPVHGLQNPKVPARIAQGEEITFRLPTTGPSNWLQMIEEHGFFTEHLTSRRAMDRVRAVVYTSVGSGLRLRPTKEMLDAMWTAQQKFLTNPKAG